MIDERFFPYEARSDRVALRDFVDGDRPSFLRWAADDSIYTYMGFRFVSSQEAVAEFERLLHHPSRTSRPRRHFYLAVIARVDGGEEFAGISGFDVHRDGTGEFGWYLASSYWNRGIATAATALLLRLGFEQLGLSVLTATCDPENVASRRVLEKAGLRFLGQRSEPIDTWRGPRPRLEFAMEREEWCAYADCTEVTEGRGS